MNGTIYLLHFQTKLAHAGHYLGWTGKEDLSHRLDKHKRGAGSRLMRAVSQKGIPWDCVRTWGNADRNFERKLKNQNKARVFCPVCNPRPSQIGVLFAKESNYERPTKRRTKEQATNPYRGIKTPYRGS